MPNGPFLYLSLFFQASDQERASREIRTRVSRALHNIVHHANPTDRQCKREAKVLKLLETLRLYADLLRDVRSDSEAEELRGYGCRPVCVRVAAVADVEQDLIICGEREREKREKYKSEKGRKREGEREIGRGSE